MGIILGALAGMGKAANEIADANQRRWDLEESENRRAALEIQKAKVLSEFGFEQRRMERAAQFQEKQEQAPIERQIAVDDQRAKLGVALDPEVQRLQIENKTRELTETERAKLDFATQNRDAIAANIRSQANAKESDADIAYKEAQAARALKSGAMYGEDRKNLSAQANTLNHEISELTRLKAGMEKDKPAVFLKPEEEESWNKRFNALETQINEANGMRRDVVRSLNKLIDMDGPVGRPTAGIVKGASTRPITRSEFDALPSGAVFMAPDGVMRRKP